MRDGWAIAVHPLAVPDGQTFRCDIAIGRRSLITWEVDPTYDEPEVDYIVVAGEIVGAAVPEHEVEEYDVL